MQSGGKLTFARSPLTALSRLTWKLATSVACSACVALSRRPRRLLLLCRCSSAAVNSQRSTCSSAKTTTTQRILEDESVAIVSVEPSWSTGLAACRFGNEWPIERRATHVPHKRCQRVLVTATWPTASEKRCNKCDGSLALCAVAFASRGSWRQQLAFRSIAFATHRDLARVKRNGQLETSASFSSS